MVFGFALVSMCFSGVNSDSVLVTGTFRASPRTYSAWKLAGVFQNNSLCMVVLRARRDCHNMTGSFLRNYVFVLPQSLSSPSSEKLAPQHRPRVVLRTPGSFDLRCVGMAAANHDIRWRGSTLVLLNVPRRKDSEGEPLIVWFDRIRSPHEFQRRGRPRS